MSRPERQRNVSRRLDRLSRWCVSTSILALILVILVEGYQVLGTSWATRLAVVVWLLSVFLSTIYQAIQVRQAVDRRECFRSYAIDTGLLFVILGLAMTGLWSALALVVFVRQTLLLARLYLSTPRGQAGLLALLAHPAKLLTVSFLVLILLGTLFLTFPRATDDGQGASLVDAAFTATSAACVTGLAVLNTNSDGRADPGRQSFSSFGQLVILILIQVGGLGIMTLSAAVVLFLGRQLGMRSQAVLQSVMEETSRRDLERSIRFIVSMTFIVEAIGAFVLFLRFWPMLNDAKQAATYAVFTSVSAYCNAGFSLWSDSLSLLRGDYVVMSTVMLLITIGGLGFTVVAALVQSENFRRAPALTWRRFSVHVRIVLLMSLGLVVGGMVVFYFLEFHESLDGLSRSEKLIASLFQSVTARTAGFNTVDFSGLSRVGIVAMLLLMFVGGSPGSTAGGVKTTTVAVVFLGVRSMLMGREDVEVAGRSIPKNVVYKSISILGIFVGMFVIGFVGLLLTEPGMPFEALLFETMSALATVGLSLGITPDLSVASKLLVTVLMIVGRVGPLTIAFAVGEAAKRVALQYPEGKIMVG